jgi:predicted RNA-binding Zn ribbon-like protein
MAKGTRTLTGAAGERYRFDPGSLCLELLLTGGPTPYGRFESLHTRADLAAWLVESRLALTVPLVEDDLKISAKELVAIKDFRDTMWTIAPAVAHDSPLRPEDLARLNLSVADTPRPRVDPETRELGWAAPVTGTQVLGVVAREAIELVATDRASRVHECSSGDCKLLFLDTSRSGNRRWCSMERCGNRQKVRSFRARVT